MLQTNFGERVSPDVPDWGFYAHLSIYDFAARACSGRSFLDFGCGTGYGAQRILDHGASEVFALDCDSDLVTALGATYPSISFSLCDLDSGILPWDRQFDIIFASNVFEHLVNVDGALSAASRALAPDGQMILAVPPIHDLGAVYENARNIFHVSNLTVEQWGALLRRYFDTVTTIRHLDTLPRDAAPNLERFSFEAGRLDGSITAIYLCREPKAVSPRETEGWRHLRAEAIGRRRAVLDLQNRITQMEAYWRGEIQDIKRSIDCGAADLRSLRARLDHYFKT